MYCCKEALVVEGEPDLVNAIWIQGRSNFSFSQRQWSRLWLQFRFTHNSRYIITTYNIRRNICNPNIMSSMSLRPLRTTLSKHAHWKFAMCFIEAVSARMLRCHCCKTAVVTTTVFMQEHAVICIIARIDDKNDIIP